MNYGYHLNQYLLSYNCAVSLQNKLLPGQGWQAALTPCPAAVAVKAALAVGVNSKENRRCPTVSHPLYVCLHVVYVHRLLKSTVQGWVSCCTCMNLPFGEIHRKALLVRDWAQSCIPSALNPIQTPTNSQLTQSAIESKKSCSEREGEEYRPVFPRHVMFVD